MSRAAAFREHDDTSNADHIVVLHVSAGAEPDECYIFGTERRDRPQLAIEVEWTQRGIDQLDVYRKLGVDEVWYWRKGVIERRAAGSCRISTSSCSLPCSIATRSHGPCAIFEKRCERDARDAWRCGAQIALVHSIPSVFGE